MCAYTLSRHEQHRRAIVEQMAGTALLALLASKEHIAERQGGRMLGLGLSILWESAKSYGVHGGRRA